MTDYERIARALAYIQQNVTGQPTLDDIARHVNLSPYHFQRLFTRWAGTTPKRFLQVLTLELGKNLLDQQQSVLEAADSAGLSSASRLHDHFVQLEAVTPGEYKSRGAGLTIRYGVSTCPFGSLFVAQTPRGICRASFLDDDETTSDALDELKSDWPLADLVKDVAVAKRFATAVFIEPVRQATEKRLPLTLHVAGTNFQLAAWRALLRIPSGHAISYGALAREMGNPNASRAVGSAIGANPVAVLIPCHRVIQQSGALGGYRWGTERKQALQVWERL
jgi:AraC family transcriptional regulator of adaptative response/methylated-DNA-[protein]-cysteine methyltransferase